MAVKASKHDPWTEFINQADRMPRDTMRLLNLPRIVYAENMKSVTFTAQDAMAMKTKRRRATTVRRKRRAAPKNTRTSAGGKRRR
jgi:hypothetical protein